MSSLPLTATIILSDGGNDRIDAGDGNDTVLAGDGNDEIEGGAGSDLLFGGRGFDTAVYSGSTFDYGDYAMTRTTMNAEAVHPEDEATSYLFDNWFDPIEAGLRERVRGFIETMLETELAAVLARPRYGRQPAARSVETTGVAGHRHGRRTRTLTGTFGATELTVPRARLGDRK